MTEGLMAAITLERLTRRIRMDLTVGPLPLGPGGGTWSRVVQEVQVTYHREVENDVPVNHLMWLTDEVTLTGGDGTVMQREVAVRQRGFRTEGVYATLRWRRTGRKRLHDLALGTMPAWLDDLVEAYRPPASEMTEPGEQRASEEGR